ncbi:MAG: HNH endonuclease [Verrucomicrobia bacterium]|nr:HNH endonuclease [Verrucomicrobiota bacterium]
MRELVRQRAEARCEYCHFREEHLPLWPFHLDHVVARQHRGRKDMANLAWACQRCNLLKGTNLTGVDPDSEKVVSLFHPRVDRWETHFAVRQGRIVGLTEAGRATVWLLQMNAEERVTLRAMLQEDGLW